MQGRGKIVKMLRQGERRREGGEAMKRNIGDKLEKYWWRLKDVEKNGCLGQINKGWEGGGCRGERR